MNESAFYSSQFDLSDFYSSLTFFIKNKNYRETINCLQNAPLDRITDIHIYAFNIANKHSAYTIIKYIMEKVDLCMLLLNNEFLFSNLCKTKQFTMVEYYIKAAANKNILSALFINNKESCIHELFKDYEQNKLCVSHITSVLFSSCSIYNMDAVKNILSLICENYMIYNLVDKVHDLYSRMHSIKIGAETLLLEPNIISTIINNKLLSYFNYFLIPLCAKNIDVIFQLPSNTRDLYENRSPDTIKTIDLIIVSSRGNFEIVLEYILRYTNIEHLRYFFEKSQVTKPMVATYLPRVLSRYNFEDEDTEVLEYLIQFFGDDADKFITSNDNYIFRNCCKGGTNDLILILFMMFPDQSFIFMSSNNYECVDIAIENENAALVKIFADLLKIFNINIWVTENIIEKLSYCKSMEVIDEVIQYTDHSKLFYACLISENEECMDKCINFDVQENQIKILMFCLYNYLETQFIHFAENIIREELSRMNNYYLQIAIKKEMLLIIDYLLQRGCYPTFLRDNTNISISDDVDRILRQYITIEYKVVENDNFECGICYETEGEIIELECKHQFHKECFDKWKVNCPLCRKRVSLFSSCV